MPHNLTQWDPQHSIYGHPLHTHYVALYDCEPAVMSLYIDYLRLNIHQADLPSEFEVGLCPSPSLNRATSGSTLRFPFPTPYLVRPVILVGYHVCMRMP